MTAKRQHSHLTFPSSKKKNNCDKDQYAKLFIQYRHWKILLPHNARLLSGFEKHSWEERNSDAGHKSKMPVHRITSAISD